MDGRENVVHAKDFSLSISESTKEKIKGGAMHGMSCAWDKFISSPHLHIRYFYCSIRDSICVIDSKLTVTRGVCFYLS
jgi:hypothetical protein